MEQHPLSWWISNNPVLSQGQIGFVTDLGIFKTGDGFNTYALLQWQGLRQVNSWFSEFKPIQNEGNLKCTFYQPQIWGGTLIGNGNWADFEFILSTANNSNSKQINIKIANIPLYSVSGALTDLIIRVKGKILCIDYYHKKISYTIDYIDNSGGTFFKYGTLAGVDLSETQKILLDGTGIADNDIIALQGIGNYGIIGFTNKSIL